MRTFLNHMKSETLDEIKTSLENFWQRMIQLSEFFQYSFVLILKRKCLVGASRVRCRESGTPSTIIYTRWSSRRYELGCDAHVVHPKHEMSSFHLYMGLLVQSDQLWPFFSLSVWNGLKFYMLMYPDHLQNWLDYGHIHRRCGFMHNWNFKSS